jgi:polysaccharide biosynthesis/export protein
MVIRDLLQIVMANVGHKATAIHRRRRRTLLITPAVVVLVTTLVAGCSIAPGMSMRGAHLTSPNALPTLAPEQAAAAKVPIEPITAQLIVDEKRRAPTRPALPPPPRESHETYRIGPRDILTITVWDHPELTIPAGEFRSPEAAGNVVGEDGTIFFPYVGVLRVAGRTVNEVRRMLSLALSQYIENVQLDVRLIAYRSQRVYVVGEVQQPGTQTVTDVPLTVAEAINQAGGLTPEADMNNVTLTRDDRIYQVDLVALYEEGDGMQNAVLRAGDVLNVPDRTLNKVFVLGEVRKPSSQFIHKGQLSLAEALSDAGGADLVTSNPARIFVVRGGQARPQVFSLNAASPDALLLADRFQLKPRDVVYVETAGVSRWNRVISQLLPTSTVLSRATALAR